MKAIFKLIVVLLLLAGWTLAASAIFLVRTGDRSFVLIPKNRVSLQHILSQTYVDVRPWTIDDVMTHKAVVARLIQTGKADVLRHVVDPSSPQSIEAQLVEAMQREPATAPVPSELVPTPASAPTVVKNVKSIFDF